MLEELPDLPHLPELPGRGAPPTMTGRALAVVAGLGADLQPAGLAAHRRPGRRPPARPQPARPGPRRARGAGPGLRPARSRSRSPGPWTLAATVEKPRGDKVLSDHGARRELAQALAEGVRAHVRDVRRRLPGAERLVVQVDEPALAAVLGGQVPTASGFGRHRTRAPARGLGRARLGARRDHGGGRRAVGAHLRVRHAAGPAARRRRPRAVRRPRPAGRRRPRRAGRGPRGGRARRPRRAAHRPTRSPAPTEKQVTESVVRWLDMLGLDPAHARLATPGRSTPAVRAGRRRRDDRGRAAPSGSLRAGSGSPTLHLADRRREHGRTHPAVGRDRRPGTPAAGDPHPVAPDARQTTERSPMSDLSGKKVAIIATDHFEEAELVQPRDALRAGRRRGQDLLDRHATRSRPSRATRSRRRRSTSTARSTTSTSPRSTPWWCRAAPSTPTRSAPTRRPRPSCARSARPASRWP